MIVLRRVVNEKSILLSYAGHAFFAYHGVFSVVGALMTVSTRKHFVWSCFVQIVGSYNL